MQVELYVADFGWHVVWKIRIEASVRVNLSLISCPAARHNNIVSNVLVWSIQIVGKVNIGIITQLV
jgi:hypothetical protein